MSPEDVHSKAIWLYRTTGYECPTPIKTAPQLRAWARDLLVRLDDWLPGDDWREIHRLVDALDPKKIKKSKQNKYDGMDGLILEWEEDERIAAQRKSSRHAGATANKQKGEPTKTRVLEVYKSLHMSERDRASVVANRVGKSPQHVRRILKREGIK